MKTLTDILSTGPMLKQLERLGDSIERIATCLERAYPPPPDDDEPADEEPMYTDELEDFAREVAELHGKKLDSESSE